MSDVKRQETTSSDACPTDVELMAFYDGELEPERADTVEAFLKANRTARAKLRGLGLGSEMLQMRADQPSAADDIASSVMAIVEKEAPAELVVPRHLAAVAAPPAGAVANDNRSRKYLWFGSLAVAAAAALFAWSRGGDFGSSQQQALVAPHPIQHVAEPQKPAQVAPPAEPNGAAPQPGVGAEEAEDPVHGVEVAAVEFGSKMGTILYVPTGEAPANSTTTVVWLADDALGEE